MAQRPLVTDKDTRVAVCRNGREVQEVIVANHRWTFSMRGTFSSYITPDLCIAAIKALKKLARASRKSTLLLAFEARG
jgi:hypothetical protein